MAVRTRRKPLPRGAKAKAKAAANAPRKAPPAATPKPKPRPKARGTKRKAPGAGAGAAAPPRAKAEATAKAKAKAKAKAPPGLGEAAEDAAVCRMGEEAMAAVAARVARDLALQRSGAPSRLRPLGLDAAGFAALDDATARRLPRTTRAGVGLKPDLRRRPDLPAPEPTGNYWAGNGARQALFDHVVAEFVPASGLAPPPGRALRPKDEPLVHIVLAVLRLQHEAFNNHWSNARADCAGHTARTLATDRFPPCFHFGKMLAFLANHSAAAAELLASCLAKFAASDAEAEDASDAEEEEADPEREARVLEAVVRASEAEFVGLPVPELKRRCINRGLDPTGSRAALVRALGAYTREICTFYWNI